MKIAFSLFSLLLFFLLTACDRTAVPVQEATVVQATPAATGTAVPPTAAISPTATSAPVETPATLSEKIDTYLNRLAETNTFNGAVLVSRGDDIILSGGYGLADLENGIPNTPTTKFRIGAITNTFTAMAIMQLQEQGLLDVNDAICDYLDDCPADWESITFHQLLTHTSGIPNYIDQPDYERIKLTPISPDQILEPVKDLPLTYLPGEGWAYSNSEYVILGLIIERLTGASYATFLQENIFDPLGMADTGLDQDPDGLAVGYKENDPTALADPVDMSNLFSSGAVYSTAEDLGRWSRALDTEQLISEPTLDTIFTEHAVVDPNDTWTYGYGWFLGSINEHPVVDHPGGSNGFRNYFVRYPQDDLTIIVMSNQEDVSPILIGEILSKLVFKEE